MTKSERDFDAQVRRKAPQGLPKIAVDFAINYFVKTGKIESRDLADCVQLAGVRAAESHGGGHAEEKAISLSLPLTPGAFLISHQLAEDITPWVKQVRTTLFGRPKPPFRSNPKAVKWLEKVAEEQRPVVSGLPQEALALMKEIEEKGKQLGALLKSEVKRKLEIHTIPYAKPGDEWLHHLPVVPGTSLATLEEASRKMAEATGFSQVSVVSHILAKIPLHLPIARLHVTPHWHKLPTGRALSRVSATVEFLSPWDITLDHLKAIYRNIRQTLGLRKAKRISDRHLLLLDIIKRLGGVPQSRKAEFWEQVRQAWNKQQPRGGSRYDTCRGPEMAYQRIQQKVGANLTGSPLFPLPVIQQKRRTP